MNNLRILLLVVFAFVQFTAFAQTEDQLIGEIEKAKIYKSAADNSYYIKKNGRNVHENLNFAAVVWGLRPFVQVLDGKNKLFYLDNQLKKVENPNYSLGLCGTVPHYELTVSETKESFVVIEKETAYTDGDTRNLDTISKSKADKIFFISGNQEFHFTGNYGYSITSSIAPRTIIYNSKGKYGLWGVHESPIYDSIKNFGGTLALEKEGLFGFYNIVEPKYKSLKEFNFFLAEVELPNGKKGFVDNKGNEYFGD